jgi:hypothetical protein
MTQRFLQGYFTPKHPEKYVGDVTKIKYRSSWELQTNQFFDNNPNILRWGSEILIVPYIKPTDNKLHKYYIDYFVEYVNSEGEIKREAIEVKPLQQTKLSKSRNPKTKLYENLTFAINTCKWKTAQRWCAERGMVFRIVSENSIFK